MSRSQERWAWATGQPFAATWEDLTDKQGGSKRLPEHVRGAKSAKRALKKARRRKKR